MASVGAGTTIGASAVAVKPIDPGVVAVGNPARVLERIPATELTASRVVGPQKP